MAPLPTWFKLATNWHRDEVLRAIAEECYPAFVMWPIMLSLAKDASSVDNTEGVFKITTRQLADLALCTPDEAGRALDLFAEGELAVVDVGRLGIRTITLPGFARWQTSRGTAAELKARQREQAFYAHVSTSCPPDVSGCVDIEKREEKEEVEKKESGRGVGKPIPPADHNPKVVTVFEEWITLFRKTGVDLTKKRASATQSAIKSKGLTYVLQSLKGHASNQWRQDNGLTAHDLATLMRPENLEDGFERYRKSMPSIATVDSAGDLLAQAYAAGYGKAGVS